MATIADAFLDDFEDEDDNLASNQLSLALKNVQVNKIDMDIDSDDESFKAESFTELLNDSKIKAAILRAKKLLLCDPEDSFIGRVEDNEEYDFLIEANGMARRIEEEILTVHRRIRDIYSARFSELEQTVLHPVKYAVVVRKIGNDIDKISNALEGVVTEHQKLSTSISASATSGKPLPESDLKRVFNACDAVIALDIFRESLLDYIKSRMHFIAPNTCALIGPDIAAQMMSLAGGLNGLCKIPSCNISSLGSTKKSENSGHSIFSESQKFGIISRCQLIADCPEEFQNKALRLLAGKLVLAVRIDCHQNECSDKQGEKYKNEIRQKIEKWQEPQGPKPIRPLPLPEEARKSKRAGKRYRKMREKFKVTELQRMKNRLGFNVGEDTGEDQEGFGMIGKSGVGGVLKIVGKNTAKVRKLERINKLMVDRERRKRQRKLIKGETSGLATSVVMTEVQGMSFVNPENVQKLQTANKDGASTYFGSKSFSKINLQ